MKHLAILPLFALLAIMLGSSGCGAFHQSFRTSFKDSFMKSCTANAGATQTTCGCVVDKLEAKYSDTDLMKLSADEDAARSALGSAAEACKNATPPPASHADSRGGDPGRIAVYVTPYYDSNGPKVQVGKYSAGLASNDARTVVDTILTMKRSWNALSFPQLYVGAIRLYDLGYRDESVYWFYTAQYRSRQFGMLADQSKLGAMGDPGFELYHAAQAFFELAGPPINGYAFGHPEQLERTVERVQRENRNVPDLHAVYPGVAFDDRRTWARTNASLNAGMDKLVAMLRDDRSTLATQREQSGAQARYGGLTSKSL